MRKVIIYGMSHAGLKIASFLRETGTEVIAAVAPGSEFIARLQRLQLEVVEGDLWDFNFLRELYLEQAQSIILPSEDELFNLNAALHAVEVNPDIQVVLRLFNLNLGKKLEKTVRNFTVLSVSQLASSNFASAALIEKPLLSFEWGKEILNFYQIDSGILAGKSIAEIEEQELKILSVNDGLFPPGDLKIEAGDILSIFSRYARAQHLCGVRSCKYKKTGRERDLNNGFLNSVRNIDRVLLRTVTALLLVAAASVLYFHEAERLTFLDSIYFVITILTTTGFGDINLKDSVPFSKVAGMCLMLSGMALMAMLFAIISDNLLKKRLDLFLGRRRMKLRGHIILCGVGDVGFRVLEDLIRIGESVVVVEKDPDGKFIQSVRQRNIPLIISDAAQEETLRNANIEDAKAIICATDNDMRNLEIGLNARGLHSGIRVVLRIFENAFAEKIEKNFGIDSALSSSAIAAPSFASAAGNTGAIGVLKLSGRPLQVRMMVVTSRAEVDTVIDGSETKALILIKPDGNTVINGIEYSAEQGDKLVYIAS